MNRVRTKTRARLRWLFATLCVCGLAGGISYQGSGAVAPPEVLALDDIVDEVIAPAALPSDAAAAASAMAADLPLEGDCSTDESFCIGVVTGSGRVDDAGINELVWTTTQEYAAGIEDDGPRLQIDLIETARLDDLAANIDLFAAESYDLIITIGSEAAQVTTKAAEAHPASDFVGVDQQPDQMLANYAAIPGSELAAASAATALATEASSSGVIGLILPTTNNPTYDLFLAGATKAVEQAEVTLLVKHQPTLRSGPAAMWAPDLVASMAEEDADVIVVLGLADSAGVLEVVGSNPDLRCIGHGSDRWERASVAKACLITSVEIDVAEPLVDAIAAIRGGVPLRSRLVADLSFSDFRPLEAADGSTQQITDLESKASKYLPIEGSQRSDR